MTLSEEHVQKICKFGKEGLCCKFLLLGGEGFSCAKESSATHISILKIKSNLAAQGDNCSGPPDFIPNKI